MVSQRGLEVLRAIVQDYVSSREPVGSKAIVDRHQFGVSAATIRNDMALLEEEELIVAPHTSSGRVPTDKGYRLFVDHLAEVKHISTAQKQAIDHFLDESVDFDELLGRTVRLLSQLTNQVAIKITSNSVNIHPFALFEAHICLIIFFIISYLRLKSL